MLSAKLENEIYKLYDQNGLLIGEIEEKSNFKQNEIRIGHENYKIFHEKWIMKVFKGDKNILTLKTNSFSGNFRIQETKNEIKGVFGHKWGTQLVDKENNTLLKIRNENLFINTNKYLIQTSQNNIEDFEILLSLYCHLFGSNMKKKATIIAVIAIICSGIISS